VLKKKEVAASEDENCFLEFGASQVREWANSMNGRLLGKRILEKNEIFSSPEEG